MPRSPKQETSKRKKKYDHSPSDDERKSSRSYKNMKHSGKFVFFIFKKIIYQCLKNVLLNKISYFYRHVLFG